MSEAQAAGAGTDQVLFGYDDLKGMSAEILLKVSMASIEDSREFERFNAGVFVFSIEESGIGNITRGKDTFHGGIVKLVLDTVVELSTTASNEGLSPPEAGKEFEVNFQLNEQIQRFKTTWGPVAQQCGVYGGTLNDWLAAFKGKKVRGVISHQKDKDGKLDTKGKPVYYARLGDLVLV